MISSATAPAAKVPRRWMATRSTWSTSGAFIVGNSGSGRLTVSNYAEVSAAVTSPSDSSTAASAVPPSRAAASSFPPARSLSATPPAAMAWCMFRRKKSALEATGPLNPFRRLNVQIGVEPRRPDGSGNLIPAASCATCRLRQRPARSGNPAGGACAEWSAVSDGRCFAEFGVSSDASNADAGLAVRSNADGRRSAVVARPVPGRSLRVDGAPISPMPARPRDGGQCRPFTGGDTVSGLYIGDPGSNGTGGSATATVTSDGYVNSTRDLHYRHWRRHRHSEHLGRRQGQGRRSDPGWRDQYGQRRRGRRNRVGEHHRRRHAAGRRQRHPEQRPHRGRHRPRRRQHRHGVRNRHGRAARRDRPLYHHRQRRQRNPHRQPGR